MKKNHDKFLIGEIAKLFNISAKTLRYYDEINLFKPIEIDPETGYRYYSTDQFEQLNTINYLKALGMPLKVIKTHLEKRSIDYIQSLFEEQKNNIEQKINTLEKIKINLEKRIDYINTVKQYKDLDTITLKHYPNRLVYTLKREVVNFSDLEMSIRELENKYEQNSTIFIGKVGVSINKDNLKKKKFQQYDTIFLLPDDTQEVSKKNYDLFIEGLYVCINFVGAHSSSPIYYKKLIDYIDINGYEICGNSFERTLIDFALTRNLEEYLTEIQIPIKKSLHSS